MSAGPDPELISRRDRLLERFAVIQSDLGGIAYEMAIRHRFRPDVLTRKAAELQRIDAELAQIERLLKMDATGAEGNCPSCEAPYAHGAGFCWRCGHSLMADVPGHESIHAERGHSP